MAMQRWQMLRKQALQSQKLNNESNNSRGLRDRSSVPQRQKSAWHIPERRKPLLSRMHANPGWGHATILMTWKSCEENSGTCHLI